MLVMGMGILDILVAYEQLWRSQGYRGGPKTPPKTLKNIKKGYKKVYIEKLTQNDPFFCMLVMGMGTLHIVVAYGQLWRSLGCRGGPKTPPKMLKNN